MSIEGLKTIKEAAEEIGVPRSTFIGRMKKLGIVVERRFPHASTAKAMTPEQVARVRESFDRDRVAV